MSKVARRPFCVYTNTLFLQAILRVSHAKQALLILREHLGSPPDFSGVHVAPVFRAMFCRSSFVLLSFFSFDHWVGYTSTIYGFWIPLWYLVAIVLPVLLRFTASDYLFGIFKLSVHHTFVSLHYCIIFFFLLPLFTAFIILDYFMIILLYIILFTSLLLLFSSIIYSQKEYYCRRRSLSRGDGMGFLLTSLIPSHVCVYPKP